MSIHSKHVKPYLLLIYVVTAFLLCLSAARPVLARDRDDEHWRHHHRYYRRHGHVYYYDAPTVRGYYYDNPQPYYYQPPPEVYVPPPPEPPGINFLFHFH